MSISARFPIAEAASARFPVAEAASLFRHVADAGSGVDWGYMHAQPELVHGADAVYSPCFSIRLLDDMKRVQERIRRELAAETDPRAGIRHFVLGSEADVFNLGGDLALFSRLIRENDRERLLDYARLCIEVAFNLYQLHEDRVHSIAVIQGDALGGGFEAALCCHTIIAEAGTGMGFPEVLFDLFPGMGAYTFLTRRVSPAQAEHMMLNARVYPVEELLRMGVVDQVVPRGCGLQAAHDTIKRNQRMGNALRAMNTVRQACRPVSLEELLSVTTEWVDAAMRLSDRGLKTMDRLVRAQQRRAGSAALNLALA
ncbi:enoyl-CoA hydratase/isomerase family protein [Lysobacter sp. BMK333-48F3]|uniref:crotonase/enoyl-CoA hydratase family protein n=1 Tax=Lysobacter sp. BMK333-48F3 TaxID=2867962 RepID=UPI001C8BE76C|nr:crotonase/enoyl-CoA hydratase family protein [Lysobacter sp. BMK333-48F3]MBX9403095.1 enoyl-CoA hydratase/isomerase family protein [Lysobacter sp. BMK333-48F3]